MSETPDEWLKEQCNRLKNGVCTTRACLVRGGWKPGAPALESDPATCPALEIHNELKEHRDADARRHSDWS